MKRVLIITYYWPPSGGAGVQRWLKFAKYLRTYGWEPVIYTPSNPEMPVIDNSLLTDIPENIEVIKTPIREPYNFYKKFTGRKKEDKINTGFLSEKKKPGLAEKIAVWIRGNLFIPDARMFWIKPSIFFLIPYLKKKPVNAIVSSGPPHSLHLIALSLKDRLNIPWLADFRDPWTNIDFYHDLMLSSHADKKHRQQEQRVIKGCDALITVGPTMKKEFELLGAKNVSVITNGYDDEDVGYSQKTALDSKFTIAHIGTLVRSRNPETLWKVLSELTREIPAFSESLEIKLIGKLDIIVAEAIEKFGLKKYINKIEYLDHDKVVIEQKKSQILLLILNDTKNSKGILTGKFFEYLSAKRPIIGIGPIDGDVADILKETSGGKISGFNDHDSLKNHILHYFNLFQLGNLNCENKNIEKYSRKALTGKLAEALEAIAS